MSDYESDASASDMHKPVCEMSDYESDDSLLAMDPLKKPTRSAFSAVPPGAQGADGGASEAGASSQANSSPAITAGSGGLPGGGNRLTAIMANTHRIKQGLNPNSSAEDEGFEESADDDVSKIKVDWENLLATKDRAFGTFKARLEGQLDYLEPEHLGWFQEFPVRIITSQDRFIDRVADVKDSEVLVEFFPYGDTKLWVQEVAERSAFTPYYGESKEMDKWCPKLSDKYMKKYTGKGRKKEKMSKRRWQQVMAFAQHYLDATLERVRQRAAEAESLAAEAAAAGHAAEDIPEEPIEAVEVDTPMPQEDAHGGSSAAAADGGSASKRRRKVQPPMLCAGDIIVYFDKMQGNTHQGRRETRVLIVRSDRQVEQQRMPALELENGEVLCDDQDMAISFKGIKPRGKSKEWQFKEIPEADWVWQDLRKMERKAGVVERLPGSKSFEQRIKEGFVAINEAAKTFRFDLAAAEITAAAAAAEGEMDVESADGEHDTDVTAEGSAVTANGACDAADQADSDGVATAKGDNGGDGAAATGSAGDADAGDGGAAAATAAANGSSSSSSGAGGSGSGIAVKSIRSDIAAATTEDRAVPTAAAAAEAVSSAGAPDGAARAQRDETATATAADTPRDDTAGADAAAEVAACDDAAAAPAEPKPRSGGKRKRDAALEQQQQQVQQQQQQQQSSTVGGTAAAAGGGAAAEEDDAAADTTQKNGAAAAAATEVSCPNSTKRKRGAASKQQQRPRRSSVNSAAAAAAGSAAARDERHSKRRRSVSKHGP